MSVPPGVLGGLRGQILETTALVGLGFGGALDFCMISKHPKRGAHVFL